MNANEIFLLGTIFGAIVTNISWVIVLIRR